MIKEEGGLNDPNIHDQVNICSPTYTRRQLDYEDHDKGTQQMKKNLHYSESLQNLMSSTALNSTVEMCEVFVIIGVSEKSLQTSLVSLSRGEQPDTNNLYHHNQSCLERSSLVQMPDSMLQCNAQIIDSYPKIFKGDTEYEVVSKSSNDPQIQIMSLIKEQYLYLSNIQLICFPDGYFVDTEFKKQKLLDICGRSSLLTSNFKSGPYMNQQYKVMHFTITQSSGEKKYLTSLEYKEITLVKYGHSEEKKLCIIPRCLCLVSRLPVFSIQKQMLEYLYDDIVKKYNNQFLEEYEDSDNFLQIEQKLQRARKQVKADRLEFYLSTFFHHLHIDGSNLEIEIYKKATDEVNVVQTKKTLVKFVNTFNKECLRLENYDFRLLFQKVRPKMLMQMFVSLLHERKIILIHNESSKNAILIEALISLLYPLQWNFTNISYLIPSMVEYLEAPFPYIVGVPRDLWKYVYEQKWDILGEEVVAFDIDNHRVYSKEEMPEFPQPYTQLLIKQLEIQLDKSKQISATSARGTQEDAQKEVEKFWNNFTLKVKQQFLNFLIFLINTFENFYIKNQTESPLKNNPPSISGKGTAPSTIDSSTIGETKHNSSCNAGGGSANDIFNFEEYVQNVRENQSFFEKFVRTQAFINFIEQAYYEEQGNLSDASIRFFKECTRKLSNENIQTVRAMQDNIIQGLMHKFNNRGISYSIDKCHLIYDKQLQITCPQSPRAESPAKMFLISKLEHKRIIKMQQFDPKPFIEKQYSRAQDSMLEIQNIDKSSKKPQIYYKEILKDLSIDEPPSYSQNQVNLGEYFTVQVTPNGNNPILQDDFGQNVLNQASLNKTAQLIKIEDNLDDASNTSIGNQGKNDDQLQVFNQHIINEVDEGHSSDEKGLFGFFKKTFSSVKKTFESTFNNKDKASVSQSRRDYKRDNRTPLFENELEESPTTIQRVSRGEQQSTKNRAARSQTFHVEKRDRKNNDSFFANLFNIGSNSKKDALQIKETLSLSPRKDLISQTADSKIRRKLNNSGFFVFNEDDMKKMTEMSPKDTRKNPNLRSASFNFDFQVIENQLSQRQKPVIKSQSIFNNNKESYLSNRMRSISYQQYANILGSDAKSLKLTELANESMEKSSNQDESIILINQQQIAIGSVPNSGKKTPFTSKMQGDSRNINQSDKVNEQNFFNQDSGLKIRSFRQTPFQSQQQSAVKDNPQQKQEFEEIYKKSTENLYFAPTVRSIDGGNNGKQKYNIWKSQTGKQDIKNNASQKPPKHQQQTKKQKPVPDSVPQSHLLTKYQNFESSQKINIPTRKEEKKVLQKSHEGVYSDRNSTDEDQRAPILGKNLSQFKNIMFTKPFEKQNNTNFNNAKKAQNVSSTSAGKHKRQLSGGMGNVQIKGDSQQQTISSQLLENIEPDEDCKQYQINSKQIEVMQIGRSRKKSGSKTNSKNASRKASINMTSQSKTAHKNAIEQALNQKIGAPQQQQMQRNINNQSKNSQQKQKPQRQQQVRYDLSSNVRDEDDGINNKINYKNIQAKTVQSSSYSSIKSAGSSRESIPTPNLALTEKRIQESHKQMIRKQADAEESKIIQMDDSYLSVQSQSEVAIKPSKINIINQSIDLRDSKKGEFLRLRSQAEIISPINNKSRQEQGITIAKFNPSTATRIHSFSQYADVQQKPGNQVLGLKSSNFKDFSSNNQSDDINSSKLSAFRSNLKPMSKITFEASNQIAKLSGDVDHEPSTPKSGTNMSDVDE